MYKEIQLSLAYRSTSNNYYCHEEVRRTRKSVLPRSLHVLQILSLTLLFVLAKPGFVFI